MTDISALGPKEVLRRQIICYLMILMRILVAVTVSLSVSDGIKYNYA